MLVGYKLVDMQDHPANEAVQSEWGGIYGRTVSVPEMIILPNGDSVHCPEVGVEYGAREGATGWKLVEWQLEPPTPSNNPTDYPLQPYQFRAMLVIANLQPMVDAALASIPDPTARAVATAKMEFALLFERSDPLVDQLGAAAGLTTTQIDAYWMGAKDL